MENLKDWPRVLLMLVLISGFALYGYCATQTVKPQNETGAVVEYINPNTYLYASLASGIVAKDDHGNVGTVIVFQPAHTFQLYTETVVFCSDESRRFVGMTGPLVITYRTRARHMFDGAGCHELLEIDKVPSTEELP